MCIRDSIVSGRISKELRHNPPRYIPDEGPNDLATIMGFLRAVRKHHWGRARTMACRLDMLAPFRKIDGRGREQELQLRLLEEQARDLAKKLLVEDLRKEQDQFKKEGDADEVFKAARKGKILAKLARLKPGASTSIPAMLTAEGDTVRTAADKVACLQAH